MRYFLVLAAFILCSAQSMPFPGPGTPAAPPFVYNGPMDVIASPALCLSLRACSQAAATAGAAVVRVWRASDASYSDLHVTNHGDLDQTAAAALAGTDATASCSISGTTFTCSSASSTPHVLDPIFGTGVTQPCTATAVGTFTSGSGTVTASNPLTGASCGSGTATMTFQVVLRAQTIYDQSANANHMTTGGTGPAFNGATSPQLILNCLGTSKNLPCIQFTPSGLFFQSNAAVTWPGATGTISGISARTANFTQYTRIIASALGSTYGSLFNNIANSRLVYQGNLTGAVATAADQAFHATQYVMNTTASRVDVNGVAGTPGDDGSTALSTGAMQVGDGNVNQSMLWSEGIVYTTVVFTSGQTTSMTNNQRTYWGTP